MAVNFFFASTTNLTCQQKSAQLLKSSMFYFVEEEEKLAIQKSVFDMYKKWQRSCKLEVNIDLFALIVYLCVAPSR